MLKRVVLAIFFFALAVPAYASSSANVEIHNNVSSSANSGSNSDTSSHTDITVETNGKVTHYESNEPGNIEVKSTNGESSIKVNGQEVSSTVTSAKQTPTPSPTIIKDHTDQNGERKDFRNKILEQLERPFRIFARFFFFWQH